jgi:hypothetical protein
MLSLISAFAFGAAAVLTCILIYMSGFFAGEQNKKVSRPKTTVINNSAPKSGLYTAKGNVRILNRPGANTDQYIQTRADLINEALGSGLSYNKKIACYQKHTRITKKF